MKGQRINRLKMAIADIIGRALTDVNVVAAAKMDGQPPPLTAEITRQGAYEFQARVTRVGEYPRYFVISVREVQ